MTVHVGGMTNFSTTAIAQELLARMGHDVLDEHGADTPVRFVNMLRELTQPTDYDEKWKDFASSADEMLTETPIPFFSLCAHHVVPFFGYAHIGYVPNGKIAGLSKIPRAVDGISKGFHVQEELTIKIADYLERKLQPAGVVVVMDGEHLCMAMRGAKMLGIKTRTTVTRGVFKDHSRTAKAEFMAGIGQVNQ
jgi:GTP cyclohydrolase I